MRVTMKLVAALLLSTFFCARTSQAQSRLGIFAGGGVSWYYGDMNDRVITDPDLITPHFNGGLLYRLSYRWNLVGNFYMGSIEGADSLAVSEFKTRRDLHFRSDIMEGSLLLNYYLLNSSKVRPYLLGGVGYFSHNPVADGPDGNEIELQPLGTEGQNLESDGYPEPYKLNQISVPLGVGVEFGLSRAFALRLEVANHITFTDYLDDLSGKYVDSTLLSGAPNGTLAVQMASNLASGYPETAKSRGDSKQRDLFTTVSVSLLYTPVFQKGGGGAFHGRTGTGMKAKKKRKKHCDAY